MGLLGCSFLVLLLLASVGAAIACSGGECKAPFPFSLFLFLLLSLLMELPDPETITTRMRAASWRVFHRQRLPGRVVLLLLPLRVLGLQVCPVYGDGPIQDCGIALFSCCPLPRLITALHSAFGFLLSFALVKAPIKVSDPHACHGFSSLDENKKHFKLWLTSVFFLVVRSVLDELPVIDEYD